MGEGVVEIDHIIKIDIVYTGWVGWQLGGKLKMSVKSFSPYLEDGTFHTE